MFEVYFVGCEEVEQTKRDSERTDHFHMKLCQAHFTHFKSEYFMKTIWSTSLTDEERPISLLVELVEIVLAF